MGRHQDSKESVVGAVVASLPLGGDAMMEFNIANEFLTGLVGAGRATLLSSFRAASKRQKKKALGFKGFGGTGRGRLHSPMAQFSQQLQGS
ncbi:Uu.00g123580.m01.CDS01 [Anthostomella pinea]|uniref:Uu.00g123580.m01.CDS01 n=1 Tax=Anthostomella pinea TaxID=933095 RepID=A0AAI8YHI0_9PEZI|nr:Uu.00g123580.m01.CDS01 [Anthostomella pinea]